MYRKLMAVICCVILIAALPGCGGPENPYKVDTIVQIPVAPTEPATEAPTEEMTEPAETEPPEMTEETAEPTEKPASSSAKPSGGKTSSSGNKKPSSGKTESTKPVEQETEPAPTEVPVTEVPATEAPATQPPTEPATEPEETAPPTEAPYDPSNYTIGSLEYAILDQLNAYRAEAGLPGLSMSTKLCGIAGLRAREIHEVWSHTRPDGRNYTTAMSDYGYGYSIAAENLVYVSGSGDAAAIVAKWMSAANADDILNESFTTAGVGVYRSGGVTYVANLLVG